MRRRYAQATIGNIVVDASGAATIPVLATFTGVRGLPWWYGIATNNATPLLVVERDGLRLRVVRTQLRRYGEIACVDVRLAVGTVDLEVAFHDTLLTFSANLGALPLAAHVLRMLPASVPLSARAAEIRSRRA